MKQDRVILAGNGFPWGALAAWGAVVGIGIVIGLNLVHTTLGGSFTVAALAGNAVFAAMLGRVR